MTKLNKNPSPFTCGNMTYRTAKSKSGLPLSVHLVCRRRVWEDRNVENSPYLIDLESAAHSSYCSDCVYFCRPEEWRNFSDIY